MDSTCRWLETRSRWSKLRELGRFRLVRASVLMPVFGYLLVLNENVHQYLTIQYDSGWHRGFFHGAGQTLVYAAAGVSGMQPDMRACAVMAQDWRVRVQVG
jgi:hypothetical protein